MSDPGAMTLCKTACPFIKKNMLTLGIETSCDETAAAVVEGTRVLSSIVASQVKVHEKYGGVVPELASREHLRNILPVIRSALRSASKTLDDIGLIAVTYAPGLIGALLVGVSAAKAISYAKGIPLIGVHHGEGHILAAHIEYPELDFPYVALLVSGAHTALYHATGVGKYRLLGQTRDDAAGEAFDKVAKMLDLPYPGGPVIDRLAGEGNPEAISFPRPQREGYDFSFSGIKTAVRNHIAMFKSADRGIDPALNIKDVAASFQAAVVDVLVEKTIQAAIETRAEKIVIGGGVSANSLLRERMKTEAEKRGVSLFFPSLALSIDNAAMIAYAGQLHFLLGERAGLDLNPRAHMVL